MKTKPIVSRDTLISLIDADPEQPRKHFDDATLHELADSMQACGQAVSVLVRPHGDRFLLVHGERRFRAAKLLGWETIRADIRDIDEETARWLSLIENVQREDLSPIEEAQAYQAYLDAGMTQEEIAKRTGKGRTVIAQKVRLLSLPAVLRFYLDRKALTEGHARQLLRIRAIYGEEVTLTLDFTARAVDWTEKNWGVALFASIRPLDKPIWLGVPPYPLPIPEACALFVRDFIERGGTVPQWEVTAFWWASFAVKHGLSVSETQQAIDNWHDILRSALAFCEPTERGAADRLNTAPEWWRLEWFGYQSDLRHSNAQSLLTNPDKIGEAWVWVGQVGYYTLPSILQYDEEQRTNHNKSWVAQQRD